MLRASWRDDSAAPGTTQRPLIGFGCAGHVRRGSIQLAIAAGYRLFDTAQAEEWYLEAELGEAIRASGSNRSDLFITSKERARTCVVTSRI